jgi:hypothetical protein
VTLTAARQVADAVLYEGYLLYPYRASSAKNRVRWQFGVLGPEGAVQAGVGEEPSMAAEVLLDPGREPRLDVLLRFLQVQSRVVERRTGDGWVAVDELEVGGTRWIPFHEAVAREVLLEGLAVDGEQRLTVGVPAGEDVEELRDGGRLVGRLVRTRWAVKGEVDVAPRSAIDPRLLVVRLGVTNTTSWSPGPVEGWAPRDVAARSSFVGTHLLVTARDARVVSLLDGPGWAAADAAACAQHRCWPVLVDDDDGVDAVLVSPIILGDHPAIAPESAGDLFDATEIDEILTLRVMTMTEDEKAQARGTDPRAAAILARCDAMSEEAMHRLHGARRPGGDAPPVGPGGPRLPTEDTVPVYGDDVPWWDAGQDAQASPETDSVMVSGVRLAQGSRVRLRPTRRADAQDLFLAGRTAVVSRVYFDVDGGTHVAVVLEDDPAADLYGSAGRYYYFGPEELDPLPAREDA